MTNSFKWIHEKHFDRCPRRRPSLRRNVAMGWIDMFIQKAFHSREQILSLSIGPFSDTSRAETIAEDISMEIVLATAKIEIY